MLVHGNTLEENDIYKYQLLVGVLSASTYLAELLAFLKNLLQKTCSCSLLAALNRISMVFSLLLLMLSFQKLNLGIT